MNSGAVDHEFLLANGAGRLVLVYFCDISIGSIQADSGFVRVERQTGSSKSPFPRLLWRFNREAKKSGRVLEEPLGPSTPLK